MVWVCQGSGCLAEMGLSLPQRVEGYPGVGCWGGVSLCACCDGAPRRGGVRAPETGACAVGKGQERLLGCWSPGTTAEGMERPAAEDAGETAYGHGSALRRLDFV